MITQKTENLKQKTENSKLSYFPFVSIVAYCSCAESFLLCYESFVECCSVVCGRASEVYVLYIGEVVKESSVVYGIHRPKVLALRGSRAVLPSEHLTGEIEHLSCYGASFHIGIIEDDVIRKS